MTITKSLECLDFCRYDSSKVCDIHALFNMAESGVCLAKFSFSLSLNFSLSLSLLWLGIKDIPIDIRISGIIYMQNVVFVRENYGEDAKLWRYNRH